MIGKIKFYTDSLKFAHTMYWWSQQLIYIPQWDTINKLDKLFIWTTVQLFLLTAKMPGGKILHITCNELNKNGILYNYDFWNISCPKISEKPTQYTWCTFISTSFHLVHYRMLFRHIHNYHPRKFFSACSQGNMKH